MNLAKGHITELTQKTRTLNEPDYILFFLVCQDLQDEILCSEAEKAGNCDQLPWNGKCRMTCGRCGTFISTFLVLYSRSLYDNPSSRTSVISFLKTVFFPNNVSHAKIH